MSRPGCWSKVFWAVCLAACAPRLFAVADRGYSFDRGERDDAEKRVVIKDEPSKSKSKEEKDNNARAVNTHIKNLSDPDFNVRENSAEMLGILNTPEAVPALIEALQDDHLNVQIKAHGALNKITGKNFGYKNYAEWRRWWVASKEEFLKDKARGPSDINLVRAKNSNTQGLLALRSGQLAMAEPLFRDAVNQDPQTPDYRNNLGLVVMEMGRYIDAINYFEETIGLDDALPQPYMNIGSCYARMSRHIEAQHWFRKAMERDKEGKLWEPFWTLGKEYLQKGDFHMAWEFLDQARMKAERNRVYDPRIYRDLALTHYGLDQFHSAWKEVQNVRQIGYDLDAGFVEKVKKALLAMGVDPDKEDAKARTPDQQP